MWITRRITRMRQWSCWIRYSPLWTREFCESNTAARTILAKLSKFVAVGSESSNSLYCNVSGIKCHMIKSNVLYRLFNATSSDRWVPDSLAEINLAQPEPE